MMYKDKERFSKSRSILRRIWKGNHTGAISKKDLQHSSL